MKNASLGWKSTFYEHEKLHIYIYIYIERERERERDTNATIRIIEENSVYSLNSRLRSFYNKKLTVHF